MYSCLVVDLRPNIRPPILLHAITEMLLAQVRVRLVIYHVRGRDLLYPDY